MEEHEGAIINEWFDKVTEKDIIYMLGDIAFDERSVLEIGRWPGRKRICLGNHDQENAALWLAAGFEKIFGLHCYVRSGFKKAWLSHAPVHPHELRNKKSIHGHVHYGTIQPIAGLLVDKESLKGKEDGLGAFSEERVAPAPPGPDPRYVNVCWEAQGQFLTRLHDHLDPK